MRLCGKCQSKVADNVRFCDVCTAERNKAVEAVAADGIRQHTVSDRVTFAFLYASERWKRKVQPKAMKLYPLCALCGAATQLIDHIVPAGEAIRQAQVSGRYPLSKYAGFYFVSNLQGLCATCHGIKTLEDKRHVGVWPDVVAKEQAQPKKVYSF
jgi:5-methylcytosine-specific restriction endonuclease McrA